MEANIKCCCVIGDVFVDVQANGVSRLPLWNSDTEAESIEVLPGGSAANTARQLHAVLKADLERGSYVKFISTIGNDYFGKIFKDICENEGLSCHLEELDCATSVCMCLSGPLDRAFVSCYSSTDAFEYKHMEPQIPGNIHHLHIGGYFNNIGLHTQDFVDGCRMLKSRGVTISISTQYDSREKWTGENDILRDVFPLCNIVFVNEKELEKLLPVLAGHQDVIVIETRGAEGSRIYTKGVTLTKRTDSSTLDVNHKDVPSIEVSLESPVNNVVDATGAGDAFIAGFLDKWIGTTVSDNLDQEVRLANCCKHGHRIAGLNVQRLGACRQPITKIEINNDF